MKFNGVRSYFEEGRKGGRSSKENKCISRMKENGELVKEKKEGIEERKEMGIGKECRG